MAARKKPSSRELTNALRKVDREIHRRSQAWYERGGNAATFWKNPVIVRLSKKREDLARERDRLYPSELMPRTGGGYRRRPLSKRAIAHRAEVEQEYEREMAHLKRVEEEGFSSAAYRRAESLDQKLAPLGSWTPGVSRAAFEVLADAWEEAGFMSRARSYRAAAKARADRRKKRFS